MKLVASDFPDMPIVPAEIANFVKLVGSGDINALHTFVERGLDLNGKDQFGDTILESVVTEFHYRCPPLRYEIILQMIRLGADPRRRGDAGTSALYPAILSMDTEMIRILLDAGADPNADEMDEPTQSLLDRSILNYCFDIWEDLEPESATPEELGNVDAYLAYLARLAAKYGAQPPDHLLLLRAKGALTFKELSSRDVSAC